MIIIAKISIVPPPLLKQTTHIVTSAYNLVNAQSMVATFAQLKISTTFLVSSFLQLNDIPTDVRVILPRKNTKRLPGQTCIRGKHPSTYNDNKQFIRVIIIEIT
jgi:5-methylcytosine-specific restriction endonuclease McrA